MSGRVQVSESHVGRGTSFERVYHVQSSDVGMMARFPSGLNHGGEIEIVLYSRGESYELTAEDPYAPREAIASAILTLESLQGDSRMREVNRRESLGILRDYERKGKKTTRKRKFMTVRK